MSEGDDSRPGAVTYLRRSEWFVIGLAATAELWILSAVPGIRNWGSAELLGYLLLFLVAIFVPIGLYYRATLRRADDLRGFPPGG